MTVFDSIATSLTWIEQHWTVYNERRLDYRGGYPADSMPEHVSGSSEPAGLPDCAECKGTGKKKSHDVFVRCPYCKGTGCASGDVTHVRVRAADAKIKAHLETARIALRGVESEMAFLVNATKRLEDPPTQACGNVTCPDAKIFDMIGNDRPHDSDGRCAACHMAWKRSGYTRERSIKWQSTEGCEVVA